MLCEAPMRTDLLERGRPGRMNPANTLMAAQTPDKPTPEQRKQARRRGRDVGTRAGLPPSMRPGTVAFQQTHATGTVALQKKNARLGLPYSGEPRASVECGRLESNQHEVAPTRPST